MLGTPADHRLGGRRRPAHRRDRAQPRAVRAARGAGAGCRRQQGGRRGQSEPARDVLRQGLARHGIRAPGHAPVPTHPLQPHALHARRADAGRGAPRRRRPRPAIEHVGIGAMQPRHVIERIGPGSLLIVPGDREDVVHATIAADAPAAPDLPRGATHRPVARPFPVWSTLHGPIPHGAGRPRVHGRLPTAQPGAGGGIRQAGMFAYLVPQDTYAAASRVHDLLVKTHPADRDKTGRSGRSWRATSMSMHCCSASTSAGCRRWC